jgi:hypothetical protein
MGRVRCRGTCLLVTKLLFIIFCLCWKLTDGQLASKRVLQCSCTDVSRLIYAAWAMSVPMNNYTNTGFHFPLELKANCSLGVNFLKTIGWTRITTRYNIHVTGQCLKIIIIPLRLIITICSSFLALGINFWAPLMVFFFKDTLTIHFPLIF